MTIQIGPVNYGKYLSPMLQEISQRKNHIDLNLVCDDGSVAAHKYFMAAQSKFLKGMLLETEGITEVKLPGVKIEHMKRSIKFMYAGKLNVKKRSF